MASIFRKYNLLWIYQSTQIFHSSWFFVWARNLGEIFYLGANFFPIFTCYVMYSKKLLNLPGTLRRVREQWDREASMKEKSVENWVNSFLRRSLLRMYLNNFMITKQLKWNEEVSHVHNLDWCSSMQNALGLGHLWLGVGLK